MELVEINSVIKKLDAEILNLDIEDFEKEMNSNNIKEPLEFDEPKEGEEETCARIRPLLKVIRRPLVHFDLTAKPSTSEDFINDHPVSSLEGFHSDINEFTLYGDIRPESLIQEEMARRGYRHCSDHL